MHDEHWFFVQIFYFDYDVAAIPVGDGKFRVGKCKVVREIDQDRIHGWLGLTPDTPEGDKPALEKRSA
jgi:hypothetical protein